MRRCGVAAELFRCDVDEVMFEMQLTRVGRRVLEPRGIQLSHDHHDNNHVSHEYLKYFYTRIIITQSIT